MLTVDGRSFLPLPAGRKVNWPDRYLVLQTHRGDVPVRFHHAAIRNQRWKLLHPSGFERETMPSGVPLELFDMLADPAEQKNCAPEQPAIVRQSKQAYEEWFTSVSATRPYNSAPPAKVRVCQSPE